MFCINCSHSDTKVTNSRPHKKQPAIWRRRHCPNCRTTFTTLENPDVSGLLQVQHSTLNKVIQYEKGVLLISLLTALQSAGGRASDAYYLTETVEQQLLAYLRTHKELSNVVNTKIIAQIAYQALSAFHPVAGLSYGAAQGLIATGSQKKRPGRPRTY